MEPNFQLAQTKLSLRHLSEHGTVDEIEKLLACIREVTPRIENRIAREKIAIAKRGTESVHSDFTVRF